jgi:hypothetical protein
MKTITLEEKVRYAHVRLDTKLLWTGFRCVQVRLHTKLMKNLVFHYNCSLLTGFRCVQSPLWTGFTV